VLSLPKVAADRKTRDTLELLLDDPDPLVRIEVVRALGDLGDVHARTALRDRLEIESDARVRRRVREVMRDLTEPRRASDPARDEIERLQVEQAALKVRLAKLETIVSGNAPPVPPRRKRPGRKKRKGSKA
jgi:aminopeptidase N